MALWRKKNKQPTRRQAAMSDDEYLFRRSRTLTGSTSSSVVATGERQAQLKSPRLKAQELRIMRRKLFGGLLLAILLAIGVYWLLTQFTARIAPITFSPHTTVTPPQERYIEAIQAYLRGRPLERFQFALNVKDLTKHVQSSLPEVAEVESIPDSAIGQGKFAVMLRQPVVSWQVGGTLQYVDKSGISFTQNYYNKPDVIIEDESGIDPKVYNDMAITSSRFLGFVGRVVALTDDTPLGSVVKVSISRDVGSRSVEVWLEGRNYPVRMYTERDPAEQVEDMMRAVQHLEGGGRQPEYIDVRVAGRAFFRER